MEAIITTFWFSCFKIFLKQGHLLSLGKRFLVIFRERIADAELFQRKHQVACQWRFPCTFAARLAGQTWSSIAWHELFANVAGVNTTCESEGRLVKCSAAQAPEPHQTEWLQNTAPGDGTTSQAGGGGAQ